jgi:hypothetical protein
MCLPGCFLPELGSWTTGVPNCLTLAVHYCNNPSAPSWWAFLSGHLRGNDIKFQVDLLFF